MAAESGQALMVAALTATEQDSWPPRMLLAATGLSGGGFLTINRIEAGQRTPVRGANLIVMTGDPSYVVVDAELPFGVPVTYELIENGVTAPLQGPYTLTLPGGKVALTDAITGQASEVKILAIGDRTRDAPSTVFNIDAKNRIVSGPVGQFQTTVEYFTETTSAADALSNLLGTATQGIVQQRQPGGYDGVDDYLAVLSVADRRWSQDGSDPRRVWSVRVAQCDGWGANLEARGYTYQDVADAYTGLTYADLAGDYATYLLMAQGDYS
jgi:hypothetical protein